MARRILPLPRTPNLRRHRVQLRHGRLRWILRRRRHDPHRPLWKQCPRVPHLRGGCSGHVRAVLAAEAADGTELSGARGAGGFGVGDWGE